MLRERYGLDLRSLALFRIGLATVLLGDLLQRAPNFWAHYTDFGLLPRWAVLQWVGPRAWLSPYVWSAAPAWTAFLLILEAGVAVALLVGWHSRVASLLSWFLLASLHIRNPAILAGGDNVLRILSFWAVFLPLAEVGSLDRRQGRVRGSPSPVLGVAGFAVQLQFCLVYWSSVAFRWGPEWTRTGEILTQALHRDFLVTSWGRVLAGWPSLHPLFAQATLAVEILVPLLVWSPKLTGPLRFTAVLTGVLFHLVALGSVFHLGIFPWICAVGWLLFVPPWLWDRLAAVRFPALARLPEPAAPSSRAGQRSVALLAAAALALVLGFNLVFVFPRFAMPKPLWRIGEVLGIHQEWAMFSLPRDYTGWFVVGGDLADGGIVDVWREQPLDVQRPDSIYEITGGNQWAKYFSNLPDPEFVSHRRLFLQYLCRRWNARHGDDPGRRVRNVKLVLMVQRIVAPGELLPPQAVVLYALDCEGEGD